MQPDTVSALIDIFLGTIAATSFTLVITYLWRNKDENP